MMKTIQVNGFFTGCSLGGTQGLNQVVRNQRRFLPKTDDLVDAQG
ncbi:MAG: hypothetical protein R3E89_04085 [Thiolinea sp.]